MPIAFITSLAIIVPTALGRIPDPIEPNPEYIITALEPIDEQPFIDATPIAHDTPYLLGSITHKPRLEFFTSGFV